MDQEMIKIKLLQTSEENRKKKKNTDQKRETKEGKWKRHFIRSRMVFPVKKLTCVISGVFSRKKTLAGENRGKRDDSSQEITEADETLSLGKSKESFWESARVRLKILVLGQRLTKTTKRRRRSLHEGLGEDELCKKRILMGERCKPINRSGILHYDGDGIFLPDP